MTLRNIKLFIGISILLAYISIGIFGLFKFNHMSEIPMENCPYTQNSYSLCENILDHISTWHQFSNVIFPSSFTLSFLILGMVLYLFEKAKLFNQISHLFYRWKYYLDNKKLYSYPQKIIKWLTLLENSPSFSFTA